MEFLRGRCLTPCLSLCAGTATRHNMDALAEFYGRSTVHFEDIAGKGAKQLTFNQITLDVAADYAAEDADITLQLHQHLMPSLQASRA